MWKKYIFLERRELIESMLRRGSSSCEVLLGFTGALPTIVTYGPAGLNACIKMVGLMPKEKYLGDIINSLRSLAKHGSSRTEIARFLLEKIYVDEILDLGKLFTVELVGGRTKTNIEATHSAVLLFFTPPSTSIMVKAEVTIHRDDIIFEYANLMHDIYHGGRQNWGPAYVFHVREIWDKSVGRYGVRIYP